MTSAADRPRPHASGRRPLRVAPAWVGAPRPSTGTQHLFGQGVLPVREAVWIWSVRRFARVALWGLPAAALAYGWTTLQGTDRLADLIAMDIAAWLGLVAMVAVTALLSGSRGRRPAVAGLLLGLAGTVMLLPMVALRSVPEVAADPRVAGFGVAAAAVTGAGWLLIGWAVLRSGMLNPADGVLLILAAVSVGAGTFAVDPLPTVGALLLLAAGMGLAWTGSRLIPRA